MAAFSLLSDLPRSSFPTLRLHSSGAGKPSQHYSLPQHLVCSVLPMMLSLVLLAKEERAARCRSCWRHDVTISCCPLVTLCTVGQTQALTSRPRRKKIRGWVLHPSSTLSETVVGCRLEDQKNWAPCSLAPGCVWPWYRHACCEEYVWVQDPRLFDCSKSLWKDPVWVPTGHGLMFEGQYLHRHLLQ